MAAVADVGIPSVNSGTNAPAAVALFAASGPATPSIAPLPPSPENSLGYFDSFRSAEYDKNVGISAPPAGTEPNGKPIAVPRNHAGHERFQSSFVIMIEVSLLRFTSSPFGS